MAGRFPPVVMAFQPEMLHRIISKLYILLFIRKPLIGPINSCCQVAFFARGECGLASLDFVVLPLAIILRNRHVRGTLGKCAARLMLLPNRKTFRALFTSAAHYRSVAWNPSWTIVGNFVKKLNLIEIRIYVFQKYTFSSDLVNCYIGTAGIPVSLLVMDLAHRICEYASPC
jgi:hypothetical protein